MDRCHATNLGLASAVTKKLLETLRDRKAPLASYLVRQGDLVLERALGQAGFVKADLRSATEFDEYVEYSAAPEKALAALGLRDARMGDVLALALDGGELDRLSAYHFTLAAAIAPYLSDSIQFAPLLAGLIEFIASLPPGGVPPGSRGPAEDFPSMGEL
jgi:hypothetical protein